MAGEQILVVETDPDIADLIVRQALKPLGYRVAAVSDAASALKGIAQGRPDLILSNLNLPGLSGKDLLTALDAQGLQIPLIVIAEKGQEMDAIHAFRLGATDVLFWPLRDAEVVSVVERALRQTQEARERQKLARQLKTTNETLQRRLNDLTTILATAKAVVSLTDQRALLERILQSAKQVAQADMCWLTLRDEQQNVYLLRAHLNLPEAWAKKINQPVDDGLSSLVALSGESLLMHGAALQRFKIASLGKAAGVIPIKVQAEVIGLLMVVRKEDREFTRDEQALLEGMADFAALSLVNARLFRALEQTAEAAKKGEQFRYAALESAREAIRVEVPAALYPLNHLMSETAGALNDEQKKALETARAALQRLSRFSEKTIVPAKQ